MKLGISTVLLAIFASLATSHAVAQSQPAATETLKLSAFGAATGTHTGLGGGKNVGVTGGVDLTLGIFRSFVPSIEIRGTYPFYKGNTDSLVDALGGVTIARVYGRYHPYVDALFGRTEITYVNGGYPNPADTFRYTKSPSNLLSLGGGVDVDLTYHWAVKADLQWQHYSSPVAASGHLNAEPLSVGAVYRFNFRRRSHFR